MILISPFHDFIKKKIYVARSFKNKKKVAQILSKTDLKYI